MGWHQILCLLCFHFCLHSSLRFALPLCPPDQRDALLHFKNSFVFDGKASDPYYWYSSDSHYQEPYLVKSYPKTNSWYNGMDCCSWDNAACDGATSNVIGLILTCSWLRGTLHSNGSLFLLRHLRNLNLSHNDFSGSQISSNLSAFATLTHLNLFGSSFLGLQGPLPRSLVKCVNLSTLDLNHNEFSDIFRHWLKASQLYTLDLQSNKFYGRINLTTFGLSFPTLQNLFISNNNFIGQWPTEFFSNTSLGIIDLSDKKFGGPIPLPSLVTYYYSIASNNITKKIPSLICNATRLKIIDLSNNSLTGSLPQCLTNFSIDLLVLNLRMIHLEGTIPEYFSSRSLKVLVLRSNNLKNLLDNPRGAHLFPKLHILDLPNNSFSGPLPTNLIMKLKGMMNGENVQDTSMYMTRSFLRRTYENLVAMMMKGLEVELVRILIFLIIIDLSYNLGCNSFQGNIPKVIGHLHFLVGLNLSHNYLTGHESWFKQKTVWIGYAFGIIIGISIAYVGFEMGRPKWLMQGVGILESGAVEWMEKSK
ncbi:hypothetical protein EUGRSUZ_L01994 [Eucalyptus grandis]|uniref:Leucine-rich repeat-containing N-terminal plant-type domain-containing protein n=1 Tax=Eucalyptus grandis TaxID=71139 RepID=A0A058ZTZ5_EUCGR|nr:hypothetical protein EUGRSUZ_L01994 [Eucalyptus grandis]